MATLSQEDLDAIAARLGAGGSSSRIFETLDQLSKLDFADFTKELGKFTDAIKRSTPVQKNFEDLINANKRALDANHEGLNELDKAIEKNKEAYKNEADAVKRVELLRQQQNLITARSQTAVAVAAGMTRTALTNFGVSLIGLVETQIKQSYEIMATLQTSLDGVNVATKVLVAQNTQAKQTMGLFFDAISGVTAILTLFAKSPIVKAVLVGFSLLSQGAKVLSDKIHDINEKQLETLRQELTNTVNAFNTITSTGAILSGGMTQMREMSLQAGVSLMAFSNIIKKAQGDMSMMGMGMGEATKRIAGVSGQLQKSDLGLQLRALGYGIEEQGELTASMFANLNAAGDRRRYSDEQVARMTVQYGKDLKILGDITGQDAKKAMEKARMQAMEADLMARAMQQGGPAAVEKLQRQLAVLPEGLKKGYMEYVSSGGQAITDVATNVAMQSNSQLGPLLRRMYQDLSNTAMDASKAGENVSKGMERVGEEARNNPATMEAMRSIGMAARLSGDTTLQAITTVGNGLIMAGTVFAKGVTDKAKEAADKASDLKSMDPLTKSLGDLQRSVEITQSIVSNKLNVALENHTAALKKATTDINKMLEGYGFGAGDIGAKGTILGEKEKNVASTLGKGATSVAGGVAGAMIGKAASVAIGKAIGLGIGSIAGSVLPVAGSILGGAAGALIGEKIGSFIFDKFGTKEEVKPRALGGPVSRDNVYIVGERGPELFRPDTSGSITPHEKTATMSSDLAKTLNSLSEQTKATSQSLSIMNETLSMPTKTDNKQDMAYVEKIFDEYSRPVLEVVKKIQSPGMDNQNRPNDDELKKLVQSYFKLESQLSNLDFLQQKAGKDTFEDIDPGLKKQQDHMRILFDNLHTKLEGFGVNITKLSKDLEVAEKAGNDSSFDMKKYFNELALPRFADGGIARFPKTGSPAMLHGDEAVIPLKDGKVPVSLGKLDVTPQSINIETKPIDLDQDRIGSMISDPMKRMIGIMPEELRKGFAEYIQANQVSNGTVIDLYRKTFDNVIQLQRNIEPQFKDISNVSEFTKLFDPLNRVISSNEKIVESNKLFGSSISQLTDTKMSVDPFDSIKDPLIIALNDIKSKILVDDNTNTEIPKTPEPLVFKTDPSVLQFQTDLKALVQEQVYIGRQTVMMSSELKQVMEDIKKINDRMLSSQPRQ